MCSFNTLSETTKEIYTDPTEVNGYDLMVFCNLH